MVTLDPIVYYRLKSELLLIAVQELQLQQRKAAALAAAGLQSGSYQFDDASFGVAKIQDVPAVSPVSEVPA